MVAIDDLGLCIDFIRKVSNDEDGNISISYIEEALDLLYKIEKGK